MLSCIEKGYHREDIKKTFHLLTQWFLNIAKDENFEYQKNVLTAILPQIIPFFNSPQPTTNQHIDCNHNIPSYFVLKTIMKIKKFLLIFKKKSQMKRNMRKLAEKWDKNYGNHPNILKKIKITYKILKVLVVILVHFLGL